MTMSPKFNKQRILTTPYLSSVYDSCRTLAEEFAVLGHISTASSLISLLLQENGTDYQRKRARYLKFAFASKDTWPPEFSDEERTDEALKEHEIPEELWPGASIDEAGNVIVTDTALEDRELFELDRVVGVSRVLARALDTVVTLKSEYVTSRRRTGGSQNPALTEDEEKEVESDQGVQKVLQKVARNYHENQQIESLTEHRTLWPFLASGAVARAIGVDHDKVSALGKDVVATFESRFRQGRREDDLERASIRDLLQIWEENNRLNGKNYRAEAGCETPKTLFKEPASTQEIQSLETKLNVTLPADYKEFLSITNGFGRAWEGIMESTPLFPITPESFAEVNDSGDGDEEEIRDGFVHWYKPYQAPLELYTHPSGLNDLGGAMGQEWDEWPMYTRVLEIGGEDIMRTWLVSPTDVKRSIDAYRKALADENVPEMLKKEARDNLASLHGSLETLEKYEWCVIEDMDDQSTAYGTFRTWLLEMVRGSFDKDKELYDGKVSPNNSRVIAYGCL